MFKKTIHLNILILILTFTFTNVFSLTKSKGKITDVTIYRNQALVTRTINIPEKKGNLEILVTDLPDMLVHGSIYAKSSGKSKIHSVTFREKAIKEERRKVLRNLDAKIKALQNDLLKFESEQNLLKQKKNIINKLVEFTASSSKVELKKGLLNFDELKQLTEYSLEKHDAFIKKELVLKTKIKNGYNQLNYLKNRRSEISYSFKTSLKEAVIYLSKPNNDGEKIYLSYLVSNVSWTPQYNLRTEKSKKSVKVEYNATIKQMSGENWRNVKIRLSTSQPTFTSEPPSIGPFEIALGSKRYLEKEEE